MRPIRPQPLKSRTCSKPYGSYLGIPSPQLVTEKNFGRLRLLVMLHPHSAWMDR